MRLIQIPNLLRLSQGAEGTADHICESASVADVRRPMLISGATVSGAVADIIQERIGRRLESSRAGFQSPTREEALRLAGKIISQELDGVIAVGGGRTVDVAKLAAHAARVPLIAVPTQISHDGIASPIAVLDVAGRKQSIGARTPTAVVVPLDIIRDSPLQCTLAGVGDVLSNFCAINDWKNACALGLDPVDDFAAIMARMAAESVLAQLRTATSIVDQHFLEVLCEALMLSGVAMAVAGSSRPCSGAEHLISHAVDHLTGGVMLHGLQVAAATPLVLEMQGEETLSSELRELFGRFGIPTALEEILPADISVPDVLSAAPTMRPDRHTVLSNHPSGSAQEGHVPPASPSHSPALTVRLSSSC